jgi:cytoskeletal protein CcmA (bactofilin family)
MFGPDKNERRAIDKARKYGTRIGEGCSFEGRIDGSDHCTVSGKVIGECDISGVLRIKKSGIWKGTIDADVVVIAGTVDGNVNAKSKIELSHTGRVVGNIKAPSIAIAEGGTIDGEISMMSSEQVTRFTERRTEESEEEEE